MCENLKFLLTLGKVASLHGTNLSLTPTLTTKQKLAAMPAPNTASDSAAVPEGHEVHVCLRDQAHLAVMISFK